MEGILPFSEHDQYITNHEMSSLTVLVVITWAHPNLTQAHERKLCNIRVPKDANPLELYCSALEAAGLERICTTSVEAYYLKVKI